MVYHCSFALCKNDSRHKHQPHMDGVTFHFFPSPKYKPEECARWVSACQRPKFTMEKVSRTMVICSKHFVGGKGPTEENPDPIPDHIISFETSPGTERRKKRNTKFDPERATLVNSSQLLGYNYGRPPGYAESFSSLLSASPMPPMPPMPPPPPLSQHLPSTEGNTDQGLAGPSFDRPVFTESFTSLLTSPMPPLLASAPSTDGSRSSTETFSSLLPLPALQPAAGTNANLSKPFTEQAAYTGGYPSLVTPSSSASQPNYANSLGGSESTGGGGVGVGAEGAASTASFTSLMPPLVSQPNTAAASTSLSAPSPANGTQANGESAASQNAGPATLLRSLLTDKRPTPPVSQASSAESGTSSVDLGLITLAMLAVKSAAKSNNSSDSSEQDKGQTNCDASQTQQQHREQPGSRTEDGIHKCCCDCSFTSSYRLWLHQSTDRPCTKCNKPCVPPTTTAGGKTFSGTNSILAAALKKTPRRGLWPGGEGSKSGSAPYHYSYNDFYGPGNSYDPAYPSSVQGAGSSYPRPLVYPRYHSGGERKTRISQSLKSKVSNFLSKKALLARLDSILTPTLGMEAEDDDEECRCNLCGEEFDKRSELKQHKQRVHWVGTPYTCDCGRSFSTYFGLDIHRRERAGEKLFICRQCEFAFSTEGHLQKHREKQHAGEKEPPPSEEDQQKCTLGSPQDGDGIKRKGEDGKEPAAGAAVITDMPFSKRRLIVPAKRYVCCYCQKVFRKFKDMVLHKKAHHKGEKRFHCHVCGKACLQTSELKVHLRTHTGERPYACTLCDKRFATTSALQSHTRIHTGEKPYACDYCNKRFSNKKYMKSHYRTHTGERRYQCSRCGKMFTQSCALTIHERLHTGNKPFPCDGCGQRFVTNSYLQKHIATVHCAQPSLIMGVDNTTYQLPAQNYAMWKQ